MSRNKLLLRTSRGGEDLFRTLLFSSSAVEYSMEYPTAGIINLYLYGSKKIRDTPLK